MRTKKYAQGQIGMKNHNISRKWHGAAQVLLELARMRYKLKIGNVPYLY